ncbi:SgcJ/EcaC family oxidoreductase [Microbispora hainanensis]|uniref:SgcJ/EcaC family oxidoreductase n=1 Tax=Microbispora hainanensis TaxID=568844 RepID=A0A544Z0T6_9ACTN|nr:SgcJ/EcaC family oxidoreductase [Microbispora hainanensis]TQS22670.1 SgcJ/EcaC family oxidoreductase [Microbispora hainanensis]
MSDDINRLLDALITAWNGGDAAAFAGLFTEDADYVTYFGARMEGRQAIEDSHRALFEGPLKGSRLGAPAVAPPLRKIRLLSPDAALVVTTGGSALPDGTADPGRDSIMTFTAVREVGGWRFASFHNTRIGTP